MIDVQLRLCGAAGQGLRTLSALLGKALMRAGYQVFAVQDAQSRIRGGENFFHLRVSHGAVAAHDERVDGLVLLHPEGLAQQRRVLGPDAWYLFSGKEAPADLVGAPGAAVDFPAKAKEIGAHPTAATMGVLGYLLAGFGVDPDAVRDLVLRADAQRSAHDAAMLDWGAQQARQRGVRIAQPPQKAPSDDAVYLSGNEAIALGAVAAGVRFMAAYPMAPSTGIITYLAGVDETAGVLIEQAEDEIAAVHMALGASAAGARAMTATSGGGLALMAEAVSLAGVAEIPIVIVNCQRGGPATGLPTRTEQGDLLFSTFLGHGEFPKVVLAPATIADAFSIVTQAFDVAERFQVPVLVLSDQHVSESRQTVSASDLQSVPVRSYRLDTAEPGYRRYAVTEDGVLPLVRPGIVGAPVLFDSHEHDASGHITEDADVRTAMVAKRLRKLASLSDEGWGWVHGDGRRAVLTWGSVYGAAREALDRLASRGRSWRHVHLRRLWPVPKDAVRAALEGVQYAVTVEQNATGQLAMLLRQHGIAVHDHLGRWDGRPIAVDEVVRRLEEVDHG